MFKGSGVFGRYIYVGGAEQRKKMDVLLVNLDVDRQIGIAYRAYSLLAWETTAE